MRFISFVLWCMFLSAPLVISRHSLSRGESEWGGFSADVEKQIQAILTAKSGSEAQYSYRLLFERVGSAGLGKLQAHSHDGIAIQAAWEEVTLPVSANDPKTPVRSKRQKREWFLGFLAERARVKAPQWWAAALLHPGFPKEQPYHYAGLDFVSAPSNTTLKREGDKIVLRVDKESVSIPEHVLEKDSRGKVWCHVSALITPRKCYIAVHNDVGYPYDLACIDRRSAKVLWNSRVWATWWGSATGQHYMWVAVKEQNKRVLVFGIATTGIHVEAYRKEDGANLFRFSDRY